jgi:ubiquinone/menaquinone biosynthesis C-methylase UbiE
MGSTSHPVIAAVQLVVSWHDSWGRAVLSNMQRYHRIAPFYDLLDLPFEHGRYRRIRPLLFADLSGRVLDAGVGTGRNFEFYPSGVRIVGIDFSPAMLAHAQHRVSLSMASIELREMDVTRLDFPPDSFDGAVATFLFCVLPEDQQVTALRELHRVVKAGGTIRLLEYVRPHGLIRRIVAAMWEPWIKWAYGAGFDRRTEEHIRDAGLELVGARYVVDDLLKLLIARVQK